MDRKWVYNEFARKFSDEVKSKGVAYYRLDNGMF